MVGELNGMTPLLFWLQDFDPDAAELGRPIARPKRFVRRATLRTHAYLVSKKSKAPQPNWPLLMLAPRWLAFSRIRYQTDGTDSPNVHVLAPRTWRSRVDETML